MNEIADNGHQTGSLRFHALNLQVSDDFAKNILEKLAATMKFPSKLLDAEPRVRKRVFLHRR